MNWASWPALMWLVNRLETECLMWMCCTCLCCSLCCSAHSYLLFLSIKCMCFPSYPCLHLCPNILILSVNEDVITTAEEKFKQIVSLQSCIVTNYCRGLLLLASNSSNMILLAAMHCRNRLAFHYGIHSFSLSVICNKCIDIICIR